MMKSSFFRAVRGASIVAGVLMATSASGHAQPQDAAVMHLDFEDDQPRWIAFGDGARAGITRDADNVHEGNAALQFNYNLAPNQISALFLPTGRTLAGLTSIHFWVKADHATPIVVMLLEGDRGVRYLASVYAPANAWQEVKLVPGDFWNMVDKDSPRDDNGKLDLEKVNIVAVGDFAQFFMAQPSLQNLFKSTPGKRLIYLDDFSIDTAAPAPTNPQDTLAVDDFAAPQLAWWNLGDTQIKRIEKMVEGKAQFGLQLTYPQQKGAFGGVLRHLPAQRLKGATALQFSASSQRAATLVVQLEEEGGGKYNATLDLKAGDEVQTFALKLADFKASDDSKDQNDRLDADQVTQILLLDAAIFRGEAAARDNVVWIGALGATR